MSICYGNLTCRKCGHISNKMAYLLSAEKNLREEIKRVRAEIDKLQAECPHEKDGESAFVRCKPPFEMMQMCGICRRLKVWEGV